MHDYDLTSIFFYHIDDFEVSLTIDYMSRSYHHKNKGGLKYEDFFRMASDSFKRYLIAGVALNDRISYKNTKNEITRVIFMNLVEIDREFLEFDSRNPYDFSSDLEDDYLFLESGSDDKY